MPKASYWLGIDTSCYTTSVAAALAEGTPVQYRKLLEVPLGKRGLQQSEGVFQHLQQLPGLLAPVFSAYGAPLGIAVSSRPRPVEGSYMPVFTVGERFAEVLSASHGVPLMRTSHQEGHIMAGLHDAMPALTEERFLAVHLSGGTSEIVAVDCHAGGMNITLLGGTQDLHAGQMVDRVAVALGLPFPGGPALEALATTCTTKPHPLPVAVQGMQCSFSGPESEAQRRIAAGVAPAEVALALFVCITRTLQQLIGTAAQHAGLTHVLLAGGVAANKQVRTTLAVENVTLHYASLALSGDNAVGVALLGKSGGSRHANLVCRAGHPICKRDAGTRSHVDRRGDQRRNFQFRCP